MLPMTFNPTPKFGNMIADRATLVCPHCGDEYLHQRTVTVRQRDREDGPATVVVASPSIWFKGERLGKVEVTRDANAPERRDTLDIGFECEMCHKESVLRFEQHKGNTMVDWIG